MRPGPWHAALATTIALLVGTIGVLAALEIPRGLAESAALLVPLLLILGIVAVPALAPHLWAAGGRRALVGDLLLAGTSAGVVGLIAWGAARDVARRASGGVEGYSGDAAMLVLGTVGLATAAFAVQGAWRRRVREPGLWVVAALTLVCLVLASLPATTGGFLVLVILVQVVGVYGVLARDVTRADALRMVGAGVGALVVVFLAISAIQGRLFPRPRVTFDDTAGLAVLMVLFAIVVLAPIVAWRPSDPPPPRP